jgi:hypothetical protein
MLKVELSRFRAATLTAGDRHHDARHDLATSLDGVRQPRHRPRFHQAAGGKAQIQPMQVELQAMAVQRRDCGQRAPLAPVISDSTCAATSVVITMAVCTPSGRGQHGRDGDRNGAGTGGEAATGSNDRTSGSGVIARPGDSAGEASSRGIAVAPPASRSSTAGGGEPCCVTISRGQPSSDIPTPTPSEP